MKARVYPSVIMCYSIAGIILNVLVASFGKYIKFNVGKGSTAVDNAGIDKVVLFRIQVCCR